MTLDDLGRAAHCAIRPHKWNDRSQECQEMYRTSALAVAETLLNYLAELADEERLTGDELRDVLAELKGEVSDGHDEMEALVVKNSRMHALLEEAERRLLRAAEFMRRNYPVNALTYTDLAARIKTELGQQKGSE